jgi:hypothetical protein
MPMGFLHGWRQQRSLIIAESEEERPSVGSDVRRQRHGRRLTQRRIHRFWIGCRDALFAHAPFIQIQAAPGDRPCQ